MSPAPPGIHSSGPTSPGAEREVIIGHANSRGMTARTWRGRLLRTMVRPMMAGSAAKWRRHRPSLSTTADGIGSVRMERLAEQRTRPEHVEKGRRNARSVHPLRLTRAGHGERHVADAGKTAEAGGLRPEIEHPSGPERLEVAPWARVPEKDQPVGSGKRQWLEEGRVDDAEDRGIGPNPERQGQNRDESEPGAPPQAPDGITHVLSEVGPHFVAPFQSAL